MVSPLSSLRPHQKSMPRTEEHKKQSQEEQKFQKIGAFRAAVIQNASSYDIPKVIENIAAEESKDTLFCSRDGLFARDIPESAQLLLAVAYIRVYGKFLFNSTRDGDLKFNVSIFKTLVKQQYPHIASCLTDSYFDDIFLYQNKGSNMALFNKSNDKNQDENYSVGFDITTSPSDPKSTYEKIDFKKLVLSGAPNKPDFSSENIEKIALSLQAEFVDNSASQKDLRMEFFGFVQKIKDRSGSISSFEKYGLGDEYYKFVFDLIGRKEVKELLSILGPRT